MSDWFYKNNPNLKRPGTPIEWTEELKEEYEKCFADPVYFAEKYIKIVHTTKGLIPMKLFDYQKEMIEAFLDKDRIVLTTGRQMGKCLALNSYVKVRNKKTGHVEEIKIGEFYERANKHRRSANRQQIPETNFGRNNFYDS